MYSEHTDPRTSTDIIPGRLIFCTLSRLPSDTTSSHFFTIDDVFRYENFFNDFGPLNLNLSYKFCQILIGKLNAPELANKIIYFYSFNRPQNKSNAAVLIGVYLIVYGGRSSAAAYEPLKSLEPYLPFRDASQGLCTFRLMPQHVLRAFAKALRLNFFDWNKWNSAEYEHFESVENGDLNILVPKKFLAFSGPHSTNMSPEGYATLTPSDYLPIFKMYGVTTIIRLNKKCYERKDFTNAGLAHHELFFTDGSTPSNTILDKFLAICESAQGMIAVHCKAGLGRTGTLIGCYLMKHYHFSAAEAIAWMRICRPGCVIGPQQHYLKLQEPRMWKLGKATPSAIGSSATSTASSASTSSTHSPVRGAGLHLDSPIQSSTSIHHPAATPSYANSQPNSPLNAASLHQSYSSSFDTPPSAHQQRLNAASSPSYSSHQLVSGLGSPLHSQTRSVTSAAAAAASSAAAFSPSSSSSSSSNGMSSALARGRSKQSKPVGNGYYQDDSKDASGLSHTAPLSAPQPNRYILSPGKYVLSPPTKADHKALSSLIPSVTSPLGSTVPRQLFDNKSWLQTNQRRSPSANGLRRGATGSNGSSPQSLSFTSPSHVTPLSPASMNSQNLPPSSLYTSSGGVGLKTKTRSSSQTPTLGFRQSKTKAK